MLELEGEPLLATWRLPAPRPRPGAAFEAVRIGAHRLVYLDYEGPVSGGRGTVRRLAAGRFDWLERGADRLVVLLHGSGEEGGGWGSGVLILERSQAIEGEGRGGDVGDVWQGSLVRGSEGPGRGE